ncbi:MAG: hypothetical protein SFZ23_03215 [Planctomycetota bacterium]|nr:hypothetical protein [Planctomycetota bacterium]
MRRKAGRKPVDITHVNVLGPNPLGTTLAQSIAGAAGAPVRVSTSPRVSPRAKRVVNGSSDPKETDPKHEDSIEIENPARELAGNGDEQTRQDRKQHPALTPPGLHIDVRG